MINFVANLFVLKLTEKFSGYKCGRLRIFVGAAIGGVFSVYHVMAVSSGGVLLKIATSVAMVMITFGVSSPGKKIAIFYLSSGLFGGTMILFDNIFATNGSIYFFIKFTLAYLIFSYFYSQIYCERLKKVDYYIIKLVRGERNVVLNGFMDNGNTLYDWVSSRPVVVAQYQKVKMLLEKDQREVAKKLLSGDYDVEYKGLSLITCTTATSSAVMPMFKVDKFYMCDDGKWIEQGDIMVGIVKDCTFNDGKYDVLLNKGIVARKGVEKNEVNF